VYLGNTSETSYPVPLFINDKFVIKDIAFIPAVYKAVGEILDNSIDEFAQTKATNKLLQISAQPVLGTYTITDNGRGIPIGKHETGKHTPEVALGSLRSGRNFEDEIAAGVIGQNGVGSACTNYCSTEFYVDINRDGKRYRQRFDNGAATVSRPSIRKGPAKKTGTSIEFQLDPEVFDKTSLPDELMENRAVEIALTNPGVTTQYNGKKYRYKKGFEEIVKKISDNYFRFEQDGCEFFVIFDIHEGIDEKIFSWVNSSLLFDGGICNTQFLNAFYDRVVKQLEREAKKNKCVVTKNDVRQNLLVLGNLRLSNPEYDAQSKTRLTGPQRRKEMGELLDASWTSFIRRNKEWLGTVLDRAIVRHHNSANKKAIKNHTKNLAKKVAGLVDATSKDRSECQILITEGDSAASMITQARDPKTTASLPLSGKVNNVYGSTVAQLLGMGKITDLLTSIGLVPGQKALRYDLRYSKIVIATDADVDGGDIFTLLVNLFYQFWPELFDPDYEPIVYRLLAPNVCLVKGNKRVHFATRTEYEKAKNKYKGWTVNYYKGLGSMADDDWEMILSGETDTLIPISDDGQFKETMKLLFGPSADARKEWLQDD
jgi:DNA gyrase/topoisomerase IV subunit B